MSKEPNDNAPFEQQVSLPNDVARCNGVGNELEGWRDGCNRCLRRTSTYDVDYVVHMLPPEIIAFECEYLIETNNYNKNKEFNP